MIVKYAKLLFEIPNFEHFIEGLLLKAFEKLHEKLSMKYREIMGGSLTNINVYSVLSANLYLNEELRTLLASHTLMNDGVYDSTLNLLLAEKEIILISKVKKERSLHRSELIFNNLQFKFLCNLHYSMSYFLCELQKEKEGLFFIMEDREHVFCKIIDGNERRVHAASALFSKEFTAIFQSFQRIKEMFLFSLRLELKCHLIFFLDLLFTEVNPCS